MEGEKAGEMALLVRQLVRKFGPLDEATEARIQAADSDDLMRWGERVLDARSLEAVFSEEG